jgi:1,4-dihydroxy-2-naphthoyl-CoA synthase
VQTSEFTDISYELDSDGVVTLSMNTPRRKNAISGLTAPRCRRVYPRHEAGHTRQ